MAIPIGVRIIIVGLDRALNVLKIRLNVIKDEVASPHISPKRPIRLRLRGLKVVGMVMWALAVMLFLLVRRKIFYSIIPKYLTLTYEGSRR